MFASALDYNTRLSARAQLIVPKLADWCIVDVVEGDEVRRLPVAHGDPARTRVAAEITRLPLDRQDPTNPVAKVLRTGNAEFVPEVSEEWIQRAAASPGRDRLVRELGIRSIIILPLLARGRTLGAITFVTAESRRAYSFDDLRLAEELAGRAALAIDDARLYEEAQAAHAEAERRRMELERVMKSRALLMRRISHDVKTPLGAADGYARLLEQNTLGLLSDRQHEGVRRFAAQSRLRCDSFTTCWRSRAPKPGISTSISGPSICARWHERSSMSTAPRREPQDCGSPWTFLSRFLSSIPIRIGFDKYLAICCRMR